MNPLLAQDEEAFAARYGLTADERRWRARARRFALEVLAPRVREADRARRLDRDAIHRLGEAGLIGAGLPAEVGGGGASAVAGCLVAEEIGAVDGSVRGFLAVQAGLVATTLAARGSPAQKDRWLGPLLAGEAIGCCGLTEPGAGSDLAAIRTHASASGDEVRLDGEKIWITNGGVADVCLLFATTDPDAGTRGLVCHVVPTDLAGFGREAMPGEELGHRASDHARLVLKDVRVPLSSRLGEEGEGFPLAMRALEEGRLHVAAGAVGIHRACLEAAVLFARERRQFGRRIGDFQQVGATLADLAVSLEASRLLVLQAARLRDRGRPDPLAVSAAKLHATEKALEAATKALQIHGARGYSDELPIERHYRDVIALTIYEGTSQVQRVILSRALLGKDEGRPR